MVVRSILFVENQTGRFGTLLLYHLSMGCWMSRTLYESVDYKPIKLPWNPHFLSPKKWGPILNFVDQVGLILLIAGVLVCLGISIKIRLIGQMLLGMPVKYKDCVGKLEPPPSYRFLMAKWRWMMNDDFDHMSLVLDNYMKWCLKPPTFWGTICHRLTWLL